MYKNIIKYSLIKSKLINLIILIMISLIITILNLSVLKNPNLINCVAGDIFLITFGGIKIEENILKNIFDFTLWMFPHLVIFIYLYLVANTQLKDRMILILPRIGDKRKWFVIYNIALIIEIIKSYFIIFATSLIVITCYMKEKAFKYTYMQSNILNNLINPTNQYKIIISIFFLSILMMISIICLTNNVLLLSNNNTISIIIYLIILIIPVFINKTIYSFLKYIIINNGMIIRHNIFNNSISNFNITFSIIYMIIFIIINIIISLNLLKKIDLCNISNLFS